MQSETVCFELTHVVMDAGGVDNVVATLVFGKQEDICPVHSVGALTLGQLVQSLLQLFDISTPGVVDQDLAILRSDCVRHGEGLYLGVAVVLAQL